MNGCGFAGFPVTEPKPTDNPCCFICDKPADLVSGGWLFCQRHPEGAVRWSKYTWPVNELRSSTVYRGMDLTFVDFTQPSAPSSPA